MAADNILAEALTDYSIRMAVVAELRAAADADNRCADRGLAEGSYTLANAGWATAARRQIAARAISAGHAFDQRDRDLVAAAYSAVRERRPAARTDAKGGA